MWSFMLNEIINTWVLSVFIFFFHELHVFPNYGGKNVWKVVIQMVRKTDSNEFNTLSLLY